MNAIISLILLVCTVKFCESYRIVIQEPQSSYVKEQDDKGNYEFVKSVKDAYHQESGRLAESNLGPDHIAVQGQYVNRDNQHVYVVDYKAGEQGFSANFRKEPIVPYPSPPTLPPLPPFQTPSPPTLPPLPPMQTRPPIVVSAPVRPDPISSNAIASLQGVGR